VRVSLKLKEIRNELVELKNRLGALEAAIIETPSKALAIPIIRKDLDSLEDSYRVDVSGVRQEVARIYDLNKWFIGLMITTVIGLLSLAIGNLIQTRRATE